MRKPSRRELVHTALKDDPKERLNMNCEVAKCLMFGETLSCRAGFLRGRGRSKACATSVLVFVQSFRLNILQRMTRRPSPPRYRVQHAECRITASRQHRGHWTNGCVLALLQVPQDSMAHLLIYQGDWDSGSPNTKNRQYFHDQRYSLSASEFACRVILMASQLHLGVQPDPPKA